MGNTKWEIRNGKYEVRNTKYENGNVKDEMELLATNYGIWHFNNFLIFLQY